MHMRISPAGLGDNGIETFQRKLSIGPRRQQNVRMLDIPNAVSRIVDIGQEYLTAARKRRWTWLRIACNRSRNFSFHTFASSTVQPYMARPRFRVAVVVDQIIAAGG